MKKTLTYAYCALVLLGCTIIPTVVIAVGMRPVVREQQHMHHNHDAKCRCWIIAHENRGTWKAWTFHD
jgi:hypothetical protein